MTVGDFPLSGKIAVVTGAGSGINLAFAKLAEQAGAKIIIADVKLTTDAEDFMRVTAAKGTVISHKIEPESK
jgi:NAD(P)-dependent dehydrogenase (short-subunit alcohol dehydrogenase family)